MANFYHIMLDIPGIAPTDPLIIKEMDKAVSWYRYRRNCWIVYTTSNAARWYARLGHLARAKGGQLLILKIDLADRQGWITKGLWEWMRAQQAGG